MRCPTIPVSVPAGHANCDLVARDVFAIIPVRAKLKLSVAEVATEHNFMRVHLVRSLLWPRMAAHGAEFFLDTSCRFTAPADGMC